MHIAHSLWGGLLLTVACLLAVALHDRWVPWVVSPLGGAGSGQFVDEFGKFITKKNDYFYPLAASIVSLSLMLLALTTVALSRCSRSSRRAHLPPRPARSRPAGAHPADVQPLGPRRTRSKKRPAPLRHPIPQ